MPKKHRNPYLNTKPKYDHSLSGGKRTSSTTDESTPSLPSVNDLLSQLRIAQASSTSADRKRELAELSNQRSLPPSLGQGILGHAPTAAPAPRPGLRSRIRLRTPGPAPPPSWQRGGSSLRHNDESRYRRATPGPRHFGRMTHNDRRRPEQLMRFFKLMEDDHVREGSLVHLALRSAAENWESIIEDVPDDLEYLPVHLRLVLLNYLALYGPPAGVDIQGVRALFPDPSDAACLDLSGLAGWNFTLKDLKRWLTSPVKSIHLLKPLNASVATDAVADSWDEEASNQILAPIHPTMRTRMPFLTKLSLAHPPSTISWNDLLSLSKDLGTLTHLSLAYWPIPTRTPNMKTASYISRTGTEYAAGATTLYSALDGDFKESTIILRQLSELTYCLRWLDLEGCSAWLPALTHHTTQARTNEVSSDWTNHQAEPQGPDWRGSWGKVAYLNVAQAWTPQNLDFLQSMAFRTRIQGNYFMLSASCMNIIQDLRRSPGVARHTSTCQICGGSRDGVGDGTCGVCSAFYDQETARLAKWLKAELETWSVGRSINQARSGGVGVRCVFDHGFRKRETYPYPSHTRV